jgi:hypothetical protein
VCITSLFPRAIKRRKTDGAEGVRSPAPVSGGADTAEPSNTDADGDGDAGDAGNGDGDGEDSSNSKRGAKPSTSSQRRRRKRQSDTLNIGEQVAQAQLVAHATCAAAGF